MRVWNVDFGFGTVMRDNGQRLLVQFDEMPWFPQEVDLRNLVGAELLPTEWGR